MDTESSFIVSPMTQRISLEAGEVYHGSIKVANPADATKDFNYKVEVSAYSVKNENYNADFLSENDRTRIKDWITVENPSGTIKPNESIRVNYTINVPNDAPGGGQYAALLVSSDPESETNEGVAVKNVFEMACVIYAEVSGETTRKGEITGNNVPGFAASIPIKVSGSVKNDGNIHEIARVGLEVRSVFSETPIYPKPNESGVVEETILPDTSRTISRDIDGISSLGIYVVKQTIEYMGETSVVEKTVVACPIWFMILVLATISAIVYSVVKTIRKKHRRRMIFE